MRIEIDSTSCRVVVEGRPSVWLFAPVHGTEGENHLHLVIPRLSPVAGPICAVAQVDALVHWPSA